MTPTPFFTHAKQLRFLRQFIEAQGERSYDRQFVAGLLHKLDDYCAQLFPAEDRGGWFAPLFMGGKVLGHTPPYVFSALRAIFSHMEAGDVAPVPFGTAPIDLDSVAAVQLQPSDAFMVLDRDRNERPLTDALVTIPSKIPYEWVMDLFGLPPKQEDVLNIIIHMAAQPYLPVAISSEHLLMHRGTRRIFNPLEPIDPEVVDLFFTQPVNENRIDRHRARLAELLAVPLDVLTANSITARRFLEVYFPPDESLGDAP